MKNTLKKTIAIAGAFSVIFSLAFSLIFTFVARSGKSAYEIAVENGFVGTEQEWLQQLKGESGKNGQDAENIDVEALYEAAKKNGYTGSFLDFIKEYFSVNVSEDNNTQTIAQNAMSVVSINCGFTKTKKIQSGFFPGSYTEEKDYYASSGSGVIINLDKEEGTAYIVTNYHVIYDDKSDNGIADAIYAYTFGSMSRFDTETNTDDAIDAMKATYVGGAMDYDIAVIKVTNEDSIKNGDVTEAKIGDSEKVTIGEKVYAIGNAQGAGISVTNGLISVDSEYITMSATDGTNRSVEYRVMRTDAAINPGNSGGALFNTAGELIGITNAKSVESDVDNICYVIPVTLARNLWNNILDNGGQGKLATFGVMVEKMDASASLVNGALVKTETFRVSSTTIAETASTYGKLRAGDIFQTMTVKTASGKETKYTLTRMHQIKDILLTVRKGDSVILNVLRDGTPTDVTIVFDKDSYFTAI